MHVISKKTLKDFWEKHPDSEESLKSWHKEAENASWKSPAEIKEKYLSASILKNSRVVFNICGNKYRIIVRCNYDSGAIFIRFVGTHKEYDAVNAEEV